MQVGGFNRVRDDGDGANIFVQPGYCEADAFDGYRALVNRVFGDFAGQVDLQQPVARIGDAVEGEEFSDAVDVALDDVSAEASVGFHGEFKVHECAFVKAGKRSAGPGFRGEVGAERSCFDVECGEADSAD